MLRLDFTKKTPMRRGGPVTIGDAQMLDILDRIERLGMNYAEAGAAYGMSRGAVAGMVKRIRDDLAEAERFSTVRRPENQDGAMGRGWWRAGLRRRGVAA